MLPSVKIYNHKKIIKIVLLIVLGIVLAAVIWGVLSALFGWGMAFGWQDYRYDERGYTVGEGSIPYDRITAIDLDWIDGKIEIVTCGDTYVSLTESADAELPDSAKLRWRVDENGVLSIKYRKSSWFLGFGFENRNKTLILRIPERMLPTLESLSVETVSSAVSVDSVTATSFEYENVSGDLTVTNCSFGRCEMEARSGDMNLSDSKIGVAKIELISGDLELDSNDCPTSLDIESTSGEVALWLPVNSSFTLFYETASGQLASDFSMQKLTDRYVCGIGGATFEIETVSGDLYLMQNSNTE